jgi:hypothetical protein
LRAAAGDDPAYTAAQLGHEDPTFTLRTYTHAVKRRDRLGDVERAEFERALEWAQWALLGTSTAPATAAVAANRVGTPGFEPGTSCSQSQTAEGAGGCRHWLNHAGYLIVSCRPLIAHRPDSHHVSME